MKEEKTLDELLVQVSHVSDNLSTRTKRIDFSGESLSESDLNDLKLHLGYTRTYADLARLKMYYRINEQKLLEQSTK